MAAAQTRISVAAAVAIAAAPANALFACLPRKPRLAPALPVLAIAIKLASAVAASVEASAPLIGSLADAGAV